MAVTDDPEAFLNGLIQRGTNQDAEITRLRAEVARQKAIIENPTLLQWVPAHLLEAAQAEVARLTREVEDADTRRAELEVERNVATDEAVRKVLGKHWNTFWGHELEELCRLVDRAFNERDALRACVTQLVGALREVERHCPCGARGESLRTHSHVTGCSVSAALAAAKEVLP